MKQLYNSFKHSFKEKQNLWIVFFILIVLFIVLIVIVALGRDKKTSTKSYDSCSDNILTCAGISDLWSYSYNPSPIPSACSITRSADNIAYAPARTKANADPKYFTPGYGRCKTPCYPDILNGQTDIKYPRCDIKSPTSGTWGYCPEHCLSSTCTTKSPGTWTIAAPEFLKSTINANYAPVGSSCKDACVPAPNTYFTTCSTPGGKWGYCPSMCNTT